MIVRQRWRHAALAAVLLGSAGCAVQQGMVAPVFDAEQCKAGYPERARQNKEEGDIALSALVTAQGKVLDVKIEKSTGFRELDRAAIVAVARCTFVPASKDGSAVESWTTVHYSWKL